MNTEFECAQVYQVLALNDEMLKNGHISRDAHDFVRRIQTEKLTRLHGRGTMSARTHNMS